MDQHTSRRPVIPPLLGLAASLLICFLVAGVGGYLTSFGLGEWYSSLSKPSWTPPNELFGPVWTFLYASMAVAVWLVTRDSTGSQRSRAMALFGAQLLLNLVWSALFFVVRSPGLALIDIVLLDVAIVACIGVFWPINRVASALMVPYLVWVTFATALNFAIWSRNA